jgi:hypothetical protein
MKRRNPISRIPGTRGMMKSDLRIAITSDIHPTGG